jgi:hypothetical protein
MADVIDKGQDLQGVVIDAMIVHVVRRLERDLGLRGSRRGVFAWEVQARLDVARCEQTLRRDMLRLVEAGRLERIGGAGSRRGYRVARWERSAVRPGDLRSLVGRLVIAKKMDEARLVPTKVA